MGHARRRSGLRRRGCRCCGWDQVPGCGSGLDIDALKVVAEGVNRFRAREGKGVLLITHYTRILRYIKPTFVHVFVDGVIVAEGGSELADSLEVEGYEKFVKAAANA